MPTQFNNGCARYFCAAEIAIAGTDQHIYAAHYRRRFRRAQTCRNHQRQPKSCRPHLYRESQCGLYQIKGSSTEYKPGLERAVANGLAPAARVRDVRMAHSYRCTKAT